MKDFDKTDLKILQVLQGNGRLTNVELSERIELSPSPCLRRLKQLEDSGVIEKYVALLSSQKLGLGLEVIISVSLQKIPGIRSRFEDEVMKWQEVQSCQALTGQTDYVLRAFFIDMEDFSHFVLGKLLSLPGIENAQSSFVLKSIKNTTELPLGHLE